MRRRATPTWPVRCGAGSRSAAPYSCAASPSAPPPTSVRRWPDWTWRPGTTTCFARKAAMSSATRSLRQIMARRCARCNRDRRSAGGWRPRSARGRHVADAGRARVPRPHRPPLRDAQLQRTVRRRRRGAARPRPACARARSADARKPSRSRNAAYGPSIASNPAACAAIEIRLIG